MPTVCNGVRCSGGLQRRQHTRALPVRGQHVPVHLPVALLEVVRISSLLPAQRDGGAGGVWSTCRRAQWDCAVCPLPKCVQQRDECTCLQSPCRHQLLERRESYAEVGVLLLHTRQLLLPLLQARLLAGGEAAALAPSVLRRQCVRMRRGGETRRCNGSSTCCAIAPPVLPFFHATDVPRPLFAVSKKFNS
jgi:hypothetical protein